MLIGIDIAGYLKNNRKEIFLLVLLVAGFLIMRLPGIDLPYYQDEWKNVTASSSIAEAGTFFAHPPLMQILLVIDYDLFGADYFRVFPLLFSLASLFLLYKVIDIRMDRKTALWSGLFFVVCFYNILGSLMPDVDGSILPFFFLLAIYFYDKFSSATNSKNKKWLAFLIITLLVGFLTKLSFILVVGTLVIDYFLEHRREFNLKKIFIWIAGFTGFVLIYAALLFLIRAVYPAFNMSIMFGHANQFVEGVGRNWIQIAVQALKAIFYLSPLLLVPLIFISKETFRKTRLFWIYLVLGFVFYFILFDFSRGVLDKYLMYSIVPFAVIIGSIFSEVFAGISIWKIRGWGATIGVIISIILIASNFLPHEVVALYPKTLWFSRVLHGHWLILNPFNGGSGPLGFYVSFLFLALSFISAVILAVTGFFKKEWRPAILLAVLVIGLSYNVVMAEELFYGKVNGSTAEVLKENIAYIKQNKSIKQVLTYNDIGARELSGLGIYAGRFYAAPQYEEVHKQRFAEHDAKNGYYLVVSMPLIYQGFYTEFFSKCDILFGSISGKIAGGVYHCSGKNK